MRVLGGPFWTVPTLSVKRVSSLVRVLHGPWTVCVFVCLCVCVCVCCLHIRIHPGLSAKYLHTSILFPTDTVGRFPWVFGIVEYFAARNLASGAVNVVDFSDSW